jgi:hypothetical protein
LTVAEGSGSLRCSQLALSGHGRQAALMTTQGGIPAAQIAPGFGGSVALGK